MKKLLNIALIFLFVFSQFVILDDCLAKSKKKEHKKTKEEIEKENYMREMVASQPKQGFDYEKAYRALKPVNVEFIHDEDPDEYYDTQKIHFSPYPLIRLTQKLYYLDKVVEPGFYLLTPREYAGVRCVLLKQAGKIKHVVPVFEHSKVIPEIEYRKPPKKWYQIRDRYTFQTQYYERKVRAFDVYSEYYEIDLYYQTDLSKMIFKKNPY